MVKLQAISEKNRSLCRIKVNRTQKPRRSTITYRKKNAIVGDSFQTVGNENYAHGDSNALTGDENQVLRSGNLVYGSGNIIIHAIVK